MQAKMQAETTVAAASVAATDNAPTTTVADRLAQVRARMAAAAIRAGRSPEEVTLIGVSKTVGRPEIDAAWDAGLIDFGENRIQHAMERFTEPLPVNLRLHLIGSLQTNKARMVPGRFVMVHSLDRVVLADELSRRSVAAGMVLPVLIQVNIAREEQKHGCFAEDAAALIEHVQGCPGLDLQGLMTMAPLVANNEEARPVFVGLRELRDELVQRYPNVSLRHLSMGMTNDFEAAIEEGATLVRVGRAIFAERPPA